MARLRKRQRADGGTKIGSGSEARATRALVNGQPAALRIQPFRLPLAW